MPRSHWIFPSRGKRRGASSAACTSIPKSSMLVSSSVWPIGWKCPPITPKGMKGWPSFSAMPGMMVCIGRLCGAMQFGCPSSSRKPKPRLCSITPDSSSRMPEPKLSNSELMKEQAFPSSSTTQRYTVSACTGSKVLPGGGSSMARPSRMPAPSARR